MRDALEKKDNVKTLSHLECIDTMGDSMAREKRMLEAEDRALHRELHGDADLSEKGDEQMKVLVAGDYRPSYGKDEQPEAATPPAPAPTPTPQPEPQPAPKPASTLAKAALTAALLAGGAGLWEGIPWLVGLFDKPAEQPAATETEPSNTYGLSL